MTGNEIGIEGAKSMSEAMKSNTTLTSLNLCCEEEEREMRSRGGKKSGETRRKKTAMKKMANLLLNMPVSEEAYPTIINTLQKMGFEDEMITNQTAMLVSMWREALDGNVRAAEFMRDTAGQKPRKNLSTRKNERQVSARKLRIWTT